MKRRSSFSALLFASLCALPVLAAEPFRFGQETDDGWMIVGRGGTDEAGFCALSSEWEAEGLGTTKVAVMQGTESDRVFLVVANTGWSAVEGTEYPDFSYYLDRQSYSGGVATGTVYDTIYKGFSTAMPADFLAEFAKSSGFEIRRGEVVVDDLSLKGSGAAVAAFRRCMAGVARADAARRREANRLAYIARDPFSAPGAATTTAGGPPPPPRPAAPVITRPNWVARPDASDLERAYPPQARADGVSGRATMSCKVTVTGTLAGCTVVSESPAGAGFGEATLSIADRFKMTPQTVDGKPVESGMVRVPVVWQLGG